MNLEQETDQDVGSSGIKAPRNLWSPSAVNQTHFCSGKRSTNLLATIHGSSSQKSETWLRGTHIYATEKKNWFQ
jgi:hypothetical protein